MVCCICVLVITYNSGIIHLSMRYSFIGVSLTGYIALNSICSIFDRASLQAHAGWAVSNGNCTTNIASLPVFQPLAMCGVFHACYPLHNGPVTFAAALCKLHRSRASFIQYGDTPVLDSIFSAALCWHCSYIWCQTWYQCPNHPCISLCTFGY